MAEEVSKRSIAIACQGGGALSAFTAGALRSILRRLDPARFTIVGLSGTSGGAINALIAWYGLLIGDREKGARILLDFWNDDAATTPVDAITNFWVVEASRWASTGLVPAISPYDVPQVAKQYLERLIARHVPFADLPHLVTSQSPQLFVGAVDEETGRFKIFSGATITVEKILASAAIPEIFRAVRIEDAVDGGLYWDGVFSQNPPVREFVSIPTRVAEKPDEIWILRINAERNDREPTTPGEIATRRNALAGNLSLNQELDFIAKVNEWVAQGLLPASNFKNVQLREIALDEPVDTGSKVNRSPAFLQRLLSHGEDQAEKLIRSIESQPSTSR